MNRNEIWLDTRRRLVYSNSVIAAMLIMILTFGVFIIVINFLENNMSDINLIFMIWILICSLVLIIPFKVLATTLKKTKGIEQKIISDQILLASMINAEGNTRNEKIFDMIKRSLPSMKSSLYEGKKIKKDIEFEIFQESPKKLFPKRAWDRGDFVVGKDFQEEVINLKKLTEYLLKVKKITNRKTSVKIFCFGNTIDEELLESGKLKELMEEINFPNHISLIKIIDEQFQLIITDFLD